MSFFQRLFPLLSRRGFENTLLLVLAISLYCWALGSVPPKLHHFEAWIDHQLLIFEKGFGAFLREYLQIGQNDTNAAVVSPAWMLIILAAKSFISDEILFHRIPSAVLTAFIPVIMAEIVRQFFRKDLALIAGLVTLGGQHFMMLGRIGGYVAPTTTLLLLIIWSAMRIAWGNDRKAWIPFTIGILLMPMFYATIRYMFLLPVAIICIPLVTSSSYRKRHWLPCLLSICAFTALMAIYVRAHYTQTLSGTLMDFFGARGEQLLIHPSTIGAGDTQQLSMWSRIANRASEKISENLPKVLPLYAGGQRFFAWFYQAYEHTFQVWLMALFFAGFGVGAFLSLRNPRYLFILAWSLLGWIPLIFTTGLTNNRMLVSLPADLFLTTLAPVFAGDLLIRFFGDKIKPVVQVVLLGLAVYFVAFSFYFFVYYSIKYMHLF